MTVSVRGQSAFIGLKANAKREKTVNISTFTRKKESLLANTFRWVGSVRKVRNASIGTS